MRLLLAEDEEALSEAVVDVSDLYQLKSGKKLSDIVLIGEEMRHALFGAFCLYDRILIGMGEVFICEGLALL